MRTFDEMNREEQQAYLMFPIIQELKNIGGEGSTKKVKKEIVNNDANLPEDVLTETKMSIKGNTYHPFDFPYNFAVSNLILAGFLTRPKRGWIVLTEEGINYSGTSQELSELVYSRALPKWNEKSKKTKDKIVSKNSDISNVDSELTNDIKNNELDDEEDRQKIAEAINKLDPYKFELFCRALVNRMNVEISDKIGIKKSNDGGLDGYGYITTDDFRTSRVAIQAKHWNELISAPEIDKFRGAMDSYRAEYGVFITNSGFTRGAMKKAKTGTRVITLIDGDRLVDLVIKYKLHVKKVIKVTYKLDDFWKK